MSKAKDIVFCLTHPISAFVVRVRQEMVVLGQEPPPIDKNGHRLAIEEFGEMSPRDAYAVLFPSFGSFLDGFGAVRKDGWSRRDQERMQNGHRPIGIPEHYNV